MSERAKLRGNKRRINRIKCTKFLDWPASNETVKFEFTIHHQHVRGILYAESRIRLRNLKWDWNLCVFFPLNEIHNLIAFSLHVYVNGTRNTFAYDVIPNGSFWWNNEIVLHKTLPTPFFKIKWQREWKWENANSLKSLDLRAFNHVFLC